jgi:hypothetical protein
LVLALFTACGSPGGSATPSDADAAGGRSTGPVADASGGRNPDADAGGGSTSPAIDGGGGLPGPSADAGGGGTGPGADAGGGGASPTADAFVEACALAPDDTDPDFTADIGCAADHDAVAAPPLVSNLPGVRSSKTIVDRLDGGRLYFQNSRRYPLHWDFASTHLSGRGLPIVPPLGQFNQTEYFTPDRRFLLGALNYYEGPGVWAYEIAPYDTADAAMIGAAFETIRAHLFPAAAAALAFHPTSDTVAREALALPPSVPVIDTESLYAGIDYQPLNLATAMGQLRFFTQAQLDSQAMSFRDIAVLRAAPNDLSVCVGTITEAFQTPLSHINVLAQNRGTPNMGLRGAFDDPALRALEGRWVSLTVGPETWEIHEVTREAADAWWESHRPAAVAVPRADLSVTAIQDVDTLLDVAGLGLRDALARAIPAFGGKASHYAAFPHIREPVTIPYPKAVVVPIAHYEQFMQQHGFHDRVEALLADPAFRDDGAARARELARLRDDMEAAPVDPAFLETLRARLTADFPGVRLKFRSSTNCEDLDGFTGAGLYESAAADPRDPDKPYEDALRTVWASVWRLRAFEERAYRSISHREVGMAVLIHRAFPDEDAQGVAITANIFDPLGVEPGQYVNVQRGDVSVVLPPPGVTSDAFVYHAELPGQPIVYLSHSSLVPPGETVLTRAEVETLSTALTAIHRFFEPLYGPNTPERFYGMDIEFKFDTEGNRPGAPSELVIKQARPYPGRGR